MSKMPLIEGDPRNGDLIFNILISIYLTKENVSKKLPY